MATSFRIAAAAALLFAPGIASAAQPPCLTQTEFSSLAGYALPSVIGGATKRCGATLGPKSYLSTGGNQLIGRYAAHKAAAWPKAKAAFMKISNEKKDKSYALFENLPDKSLQEMLDVIFEGMVSQEIPLEECGKIDNFVRLLAPLPPENTAELIALAVGLTADAKDGKVGKLNICKV